MTEECQDKLRQAEQERDYALSHQKKVEIPVEKPVLYQKCGNCNLTAYLKAKEKYDTQREKLAGRYKTKTAMYEALMFLLIWYSTSTTLFQMIQSKVFISDCGRYFDAIATFIQNVADWVVLIGKNVAQISNGISNPVVAGIIYWLIRMLVCGGCLVGAGILLAFIGIKITGLYKKCCWDNIRRARTYQALPNNSIIKIKDIEIDPHSHMVQRKGVTIDLTPIEFQILYILASHPGQAYSKERLYELIWKEPYFGNENVLNTHINRLRLKLKSNAEDSTAYVKTLWGIGYKMEEK